MMRSHSISRDAVVETTPVGSLEPASRAAQLRTLKLLALVHLRNIHGSTGAGRVARQMIEHFALQPNLALHILADRADHARILPLVGGIWQQFPYHFMKDETSRQQARWFLFNSPKAESYWEPADVVYCTAESYVPVRRARLAVTLHDAAYFEQHAHQQDRAFRRQRLKWKLLYAKLARRADLFHTVSEFSAERLAHFFPAIKDRLRVVHNAVTPHFFEPVNDSGREYLASVGLDCRPFVLLPGGLHFRKNAELVLAAWPLLKQRYPELTLAVVNHSNPDYVARVAAFGDSFRVLGFVSDDGLRALYHAAEVVWFPSRYEGFGLPVIEAMACGAPVVASNSSSLPEIAGDAGVLVAPGDAGAHTEAIASLLESSSLRRDYSGRGVSRAAQFTWHAAARKLRTHFEELL